MCSLVEEIARGLACRRVPKMSEVRTALACVAVLVVSASATASTTPNPVRATMSTTSTAPVADTPWRYTIVVRDHHTGELLAAKARLQVLEGTLVVRCWKGTAMERCSGASSGTWIPFRGRRTGLLSWPARSAGIKLTFQATVVAAGRSLRLRAPVKVKLP
jgi:hypothetical protein